MGNEREHVGQQPRKRKKKVIAIVLTIFFVFFVIGLVCSITGNTKDDSTEPAGPEEFTHEIAESVEYDGLSIKIYDYNFLDSFCGISPPSNTGETLCVVDVRITNTTNKTIYFKEGSFFPSLVYTYHLIFDQEYEYGSVFKDYTNFLDSFSSISPLQTINASLCFIVPNAVEANGNKELKIEFKKNKVKDVDEIHYWILREGEILE